MQATSPDSSQRPQQLYIVAILHSKTLLNTQMRRKCACKLKSKCILPYLLQVHTDREKLQQVPLQSIQTPLNLVTEALKALSFHAWIG